MYFVPAALMIVVCLGSSVADWKRLPVVMDAQDRLRVPAALRPLLPILKTAGAVGLGIGFAVTGLGALAALCLALYFACATWFHARAKDKPADTVPAAVLAIVSLLAMIGALAR